MKRKKIIYIGLIVMISIITTGCGKEIEVKNGSKVAVSVTEEKFSATEYYNKIKEDNISKLIDMIDTSIFEKKYKTDKKEEEEQIDKQVEQIKSYYGQDEETYKNIIKQYLVLILKMS